MGDDITLPVKCIKTPMEMPAWLASPAYKYLLEFLEGVNIAVMGKSQHTDCTLSHTLSQMLAVLGELESAIALFPPQTQPQRFGNKAYRDWHAHLTENATSLMGRVAGEKSAYAAHLGEYLKESFGNATRIDFGTGHEVMFVMLLCALHRLELIKEEDYVPVVTKVFTKYVELVNLLVKTYVMEPAGSHGAWSLDDYHFVPFIWGSAQLISKLAGIGVVGKPAGEDLRDGAGGESRSLEPG